MTRLAPVIINERYELHRRLGRGSTAEVYLARDPRLDRAVAVKVLFPALASDPGFVERFRREAQSAATLNHPNIVSIYDWGEANGTYFVVMEYVEGESLADLIAREAPLQADRATEIAVDIASALDFAHRSGGMVHRDVKPGNVLTTRDGAVKVGDFGIAAAVGATPERAGGDDDAASDLYGLGSVLYEMLVGQPPFSGGSPAATIPGTLEAIVLKALAKDPADQYPGAEDMGSDLRRYLEGARIEDESAAAAPAPVPAAAPAREPARASAPTPGLASDPDATAVMSTVDEVAATGVGDPPGAMDETTVMQRPRATGRAGARQPSGSMDETTVMQRPRRPGRAGAVPPTGSMDPTDVMATAASPRHRIRVDHDDYDEDDRPGGARAYAVVVVLGAVLVVLIGLLFLVTRSHSSSGGEQATQETTADVTVPRLIGMQQAEAEAALTQAKLRVTVQTAADDTVAAGTVLDQSPEPNGSVAEGATVTLTVSTGPGNIVVPDLRGRTLDEAMQALTDMGLVPSPKQVQDPTVPDGQVIATNPAAGAATTRGATIEIQVSSVPTTTGVPDVTGQREDEARAALEGAGFQVVVSDQPVRRHRRDGEVLGQNPPGGTPLPAGSQVTIVVGRSQDGDFFGND